MERKYISELKVWNGEIKAWIRKQAVLCLNGAGLVNLDIGRGGSWAPKLVWKESFHIKQELISLPVYIGGTVLD